MNLILNRYIQASCAFGAGFTAVHGYQRRTNRIPTLNPLYHSIGILRDGMLGAMVGPFLLPYALVADYKHCPIPPPKHPSSPSDVSQITL
jgi:hypothetical protein